MFTDSFFRRRKFRLQGREIPRTEKTLAASRPRPPVEPLESRLLFSEAAAAQLTLTSTTGTMASPVYNYDISMSNIGTTNIGTFWFGWIPGENFLPTAPISESSPAGWTAMVTGSNNSTDGSAIQWVASSNAIASESSLDGFDFSSADSPATLAGLSPTHPTEEVLTSFVYAGAPLSDAGFQLTVTAAATPAASTISVAASQATITQGDSVTFTATVASASGSGATPTGTVTFLEDGNSIGTGTVQSGGTATLSTSTLPTGSLSITAQYGGDSNYSDSSSTAFTETVNAPVVTAPTTTTLATSNPLIGSGDSVTLTATVAPVTPDGTAPTGTVTFSQNGNALGHATVQSDGTATLATTALAVGSDSVTATYSGDTNFSASSSAAISETVSPPLPTTTALTTSAAAAAGGNAVVLTATVAAVTPDGVTPTGTVTFIQNGASLGSVQLASDGTAALSTMSLAVGSDQITANYSGDSHFASSASAAIAETVTAPPTLVPVITRSTFPASLVGGFAAHGVVFISISNATVATLRGKVMLELFASMDGSIDGSSIELAHSPRGVNLRTTQLLRTSLSVVTRPATLPVGSYTLLARVVDLAGNNDDSATGPAVTVASPFVALSGTFTRMTIPATAVAGARSNAVASLRITNNGNITTPGKTTISLYATLSGVVDSNAVLIVPSISRPYRIGPKRSIGVSLSIRKIPALAAGTYTIIAQVTDGDGQMTSVTSGMVTITGA